MEESRNKRKRGKVDIKLEWERIYNYSCTLALSPAPGNTVVSYSGRVKRSVSVKRIMHCLYFLSITFFFRLFPFYWDDEEVRRTMSTHSARNAGCVCVPSIQLSVRKKLVDGKEERERERKKKREARRIRRIRWCERLSSSLALQIYTLEWTFSFPLLLCFSVSFSPLSLLFSFCSFLYASCASLIIVALSISEFFLFSTS